MPRYVKGVSRRPIIPQDNCVALLSWFSITKNGEARSVRLYGKLLDASAYDKLNINKIGVNTWRETVDEYICNTYGFISPTCPNIYPRFDRTLEELRENAAEKMCRLLKIAQLEPESIVLDFE